MDDLLDDIVEELRESLEQLKINTRKQKALLRDVICLSAARIRSLQSAVKKRPASPLPMSEQPPTKKLEIVPSTALSALAPFSTKNLSPAANPATKPVSLPAPSPPKRPGI